MTEGTGDEFYSFAEFSPRPRDGKHVAEKVPALEPRANTLFLLERRKGEATRPAPLTRDFVSAPPEPVGPLGSAIFRPRLAKTRPNLLLPPHPVSSLPRVDEPLVCDTCSTLGRFVLTPAVPRLQHVAPALIKWRKPKILCKFVWACCVHCCFLGHYNENSLNEGIAGPIGRPSGSRDSESGIPLSS